MDRMHAAIAEARASRAALFAPIVEQSAPIEPVATPEPEAPQLWDNLQDFTPDEDVLARNLIITRDSGLETAPFDMLRTRVVQQMGQNGWNRLALTSPDPACGKSTVTMNLAFSLARLAEIRTVVVDVDFRRPAIANLIGLDGDHSVGDILAGKSDLADQMVRIAPNLAVATTARPVENSSELLQGSSVNRFLDRIQEDYQPDIILFDLPPLMVSDDTLAFLPFVDAALLIAAANQSIVRQVDSCEKEIAEQTNMLGVVVNRCTHPGPGYGYGYTGY
ncbi:MAG: CpsD/CapB family tyrosine-protein kinase [Pseudomonadota bacterium]